MTTPSSTSQSSFFDPRGSFTSSFGPLNALERLQEDDRLLRHRHAGLGRVVGVVQANADIVHRPDHAGADARIALDLAAASPDRPPPASSASTATARSRRCRAHTPLRRRIVPSLVEQSRLLGAGRTIAQQFHSAFSPNALQRQPAVDHDGLAGDELAASSQAR